MVNGTGQFYSRTGVGMFKTGKLVDFKPYRDMAIGNQITANLAAVRAAILFRCADGYMEIDLDGNVIECNPAYLIMSGYDRAAVIGRPLRTFEVLLQTDFARIRNTGQGRFINVHRRSNGKNLAVECVIQYYTDLYMVGGVFIAFFRDRSADDTEIRETLSLLADAEWSLVRAKAALEQMVDAEKYEQLTQEMNAHTHTHTHTHTLQALCHITGRHGYYLTFN